MVEKNLEDIKIGFILDEFSRMCFDPVGKHIYFSYRNWRKELFENKIDVVIIESAWTGNKGEWRGRLTTRGRNDEIKKLIDYCKIELIPTVFWNKEDPVHFNEFLRLAKMVDYIYTTDEDSIAKYKKYLKHERIYHCHFAAQPKIHNPIKLSENRKKRLCFAGSYYTCKYEERRIDFDRIMKVAIEFGVDIFDRNKGSNNNRYRFPNRYKKYIVGKLKGEDIKVAYKGYRIMINVNSVKSSSTMFSRRIFECLACGTPIVSSYSKGLNNYFQNIVVSSDDPADIRKEIQRLMEDESYYQKKSKLLVRKVLEEHTAKKRIEGILKDIGINIQERIDKVSIFSIVDSIEEYERILRFYLKQSYENIELIIIINGTMKFGRELVNNTEKVKAIFSDKNYDVNRLKESMGGEYVAFFSAENYYGRNYIKDLMICREYCNSKVIGKKCCFIMEEEKILLKNEGMENMYSTDVRLDACIMNKEIFEKKIKYSNLLNVNKENAVFQSSIEVEFFSSDRFNFIGNCRGGNESNRLDAYLV